MLVELANCTGLIDALGVTLRQCTSRMDFGNDVKEGFVADHLNSLCCSGVGVSGARLFVRIVVNSFRILPVWFIPCNLRTISKFAIMCDGLMHFLVVYTRRRSTVKKRQQQMNKVRF